MSLLQRFKRRKEREAALILAAWLEENDPDFRFEIACNSLRAVLKKYNRQDLMQRQKELLKSTAFGTGAGQWVFKGVGSVHVTMIGGGGGGGGAAGQSIMLYPKKSSP